jgi:NAD-dependent dihydropyrimidine dehydrogenase PreA subunit
MKYLPVLDPTRCTGCGDCVAVCPVQCLELAGLLPWLPRPADCVSCALCVLVCPADALTIPPLPPIPGEKRRSERPT